MTPRRSGPTKKPNRRDLAAIRTQGRVKTAAAQLFVEQGFAGVTTRDIAKAAGTSTGAIYHGWTDKEGLWEGAMERCWPDPAAFARFVFSCSTLEEAHAGAAIFLVDTVGRVTDGPTWSPAPREKTK